MTVYVDDMYKYPMGQFGRMKMSHMMAHRTEELLDMARRIGVAHRWLQHPDSFSEHFDIAISKRALAIQLGAIAITMREMAAFQWARRTNRGQNWTPAQCLEEMIKEDRRPTCINSDHNHATVEDSWACRERNP